MEDHSPGRRRIGRRWLALSDVTERLIAMLEGLGQEVEVSLEVHPRRTPAIAVRQSGVLTEGPSR